LEEEESRKRRRLLKNIFRNTPTAILESLQANISPDGHWELTNLNDPISPTTVLMNQEQINPCRTLNGLSDPNHREQLRDLRRHSNFINYIIVERAIEDITLDSIAPTYLRRNPINLQLVQFKH